MEIGDVRDKAVDDTLAKERLSSVANSVLRVVSRAACVEPYHIAIIGILTLFLCEKNASNVFWRRQSDLQPISIRY